MSRNLYDPKLYLRIRTFYFFNENIKCSDEDHKLRKVTKLIVTEQHQKVTVKLDAIIVVLLQNLYVD